MMIFRNDDFSIKNGRLFATTLRYRHLRGRRHVSLRSIIFSMKSIDFWAVFGLNLVDFVAVGQRQRIRRCCSVLRIAIPLIETPSFPGTSSVENAETVNRRFFDFELSLVYFAGKAIGFDLLFFGYAAANLGIFLFVFVFIPETAGKTLEEIQVSFVYHSRVFNGK